MRCAVTQADLDLGNYERFLDITLAKDNNITTGKIYQASTQRIDQAAGMNVVVHWTALITRNAVNAVGDRARAAGRLPGQDGAGGATHHGRNPGGARACQLSLSQDRDGMHDLANVSTDAISANGA